MQNSALGALLATLHFPDPLTPVPCAISACTHSIVGSGIAAYWRLTDVKEGAHGSHVIPISWVMHKSPCRACKRGHVPAAPAPQRHREVNIPEK
jgi:hypothetical protein